MAGSHASAGSWLSWLAVAAGSLFGLGASAAVPTAWQLLNDGDPTPYPAVAYFDATQQRVRIVEYLSNGSFNIQDGRPPFVWELSGDDWKRIRLPEPTPRVTSGVGMLSSRKNTSDMRSS